MNVNRLPAVIVTLPAPTREEMMAVAASRPAVLQMQTVALGAIHRNATAQSTTGQGTPPIEGNSAIAVDMML
ncbi:MAG: hypothetical protein QG622_3134 [Actinomycetota bacterium]|nr:hypothetical protein [Actinomycetota bacterium]